MISNDIIDIDNNSFLLIIKILINNKNELIDHIKNLLFNEIIKFIDIESFARINPDIIKENYSLFYYKKINIYGDELEYVKIIL